MQFRKTETFRLWLEASNLLVWEPRSLAPFYECNFRCISEERENAGRRGGILSLCETFLCVCMQIYRISSFPKNKLIANYSSLIKIPRLFFLKILSIHSRSHPPSAMVRPGREAGGRAATDDLHVLPTRRAHPVRPPSRLARLPHPPPSEEDPETGARVEQHFSRGDLDRRWERKSLFHALNWLIRLCVVSW